MNKLKISFPYLLFIAMALAVVSANMGSKSYKPEDIPTGQSITDPVCRMEVNAKWGINCTHDGQTYYFCHERCREMFLKNPKGYMGERCMVCRKQLVPQSSLTATYLENTYYLCTTEHRRQFKADPAQYEM